MEGRLNAGGDTIVRHPRGVQRHAAPLPCTEVSTLWAPAKTAEKSRKKPDYLV
ncbi:hypothetical protein KTF24_28105 [Burkholderia multivorans]|uniref:hypothetical protein n=1 Tax=Burkholderia multivorans TaxID=87883 RepID=UPI001C244F79|nr:hypothetical protein [Burkholderia multivorans]MBU9671626.1 hypothetical protein [Burkholderia multivorans]HEF4755941.1 hypothetical protein [Burkholderia multivorans]